jgi:hypothetical protein
MSTENAAGERSPGRRVPEWLALGLHVLVGLFPYSASGLMAPPYGLAILAAIWIALFVVLWRWRPANAWLTLLVPVGAVALWYLVMQLGDSVLGWTA